LPPYALRGSPTHPSDPSLSPRGPWENFFPSLAPLSQRPNLVFSAAPPDFLPLPPHHFVPNGPSGIVFLCRCPHYPFRSLMNLTLAYSQLERLCKSSLPSSFVPVPLTRMTPRLFIFFVRGIAHLFFHLGPLVPTFWSAPPPPLSQTTQRMRYC